MGKLSRKYWGVEGIPLEGYPATNVKRLYSFFVGQLYDSASRVILIDNVPESCDYDFLMENLIMLGKIAAVKSKEGFKLINGYLGGARNEFYRPTEIIVDNPVLGDIRCKNGKDGVMIYLTPHDRLHTPPAGFGGLSDLIGSTAQLLADNTASINVAQINGRVLAVFSAGNQQEATAAEIILKEMYQGQPYKVVHGQNILSKFDVNPIASTVTGSMLKELVELRQYILAQFWNSIGIDANFNMKRERLVSAEVEANATSLKVPISTILSEVNAGLEKCNEIFGTEMKARLNPDFKPLDEPVSKPAGDENNGNVSGSETETESNSYQDTDSFNVSGTVGSGNTQSDGTGIQSDVISFSGSAFKSFINAVYGITHGFDKSDGIRNDSEETEENSDSENTSDNSSGNENVSDIGQSEDNNSGPETESAEIDINININTEEDGDNNASEVNDTETNI